MKREAEMTGQEKSSVTLEVFDPPRSCSSGVGGPNVDPKLAQCSAARDWLRTQGVQVERFNPSSQYEAWARNARGVKTILFP